MSQDPNAAPVSPIAPPMLSPDRKWVWDGTQWQPVADPGDPAHRSVFAAYNTVTQDLPVPVADARPMPGPPPMTSAGPVPLNVTRPKRSMMPAAPSLQLWERPPSGMSKYIYYVAGAVVVLIVLVLVVQFAGQLGSINNPFQNSTSQQPATTTSAWPAPTDRTEFARADRYLKGVLTPALADVNDTAGPIELGCRNAAVTVSCAAALPPMDRELKKMLASMDAAQSIVPDCIGPNVVRVRADVAAMEVDLSGMQSASDANNIPAERKDFAAYEIARGELSADLAKLNAAQPANCEKIVSGPT